MKYVEQLFRLHNHNGKNLGIFRTLVAKPVTLSTSVQDAATKPATKRITTR